MHNFVLATSRSNWIHMVESHRNLRLRRLFKRTQSGEAHAAEANEFSLCVGGIVASLAVLKAANSLNSTFDISASPSQESTKPGVDDRGSRLGPDEAPAREADLCLLRASLAKSHFKVLNMRAAGTDLSSKEGTGESKNGTSDGNNGVDVAGKQSIRARIGKMHLEAYQDCARYGWVFAPCCFLRFCFDMLL